MYGTDIRCIVTDRNLNRYTMNLPEKKIRQLSQDENISSIIITSKKQRRRYVSNLKGRQPGSVI